MHQTDSLLAVEKFTAERALSRRESTGYFGLALWWLTGSKRRKAAAYRHDAYEEAYDIGLIAAELSVEN